jgi:GntR family transcriptional regulator
MRLMILSIDPSSSVAVYRQIVDGLRVALVSGDLAPGDSLPPVRRLALDIGVHFNTVAQAYRELAREGWLHITTRGGAQVKERPPPADPRPQDLLNYRRRLEELIAQLRAQGAHPSLLASELRRLASTLEGGS